MSSAQYKERKSNMFTFLSPWLFCAHNSDACENNQSFYLMIKIRYIYSWKFFPNSMGSHWLLRGHITSNNETVSRQNLSAGNLAKSMTPKANSTVYL